MATSIQTPLMRRNAEKLVGQRRKYDYRWSSVYLVESSGYFKIGLAGQFKERLNSLQCGNPLPITVVDHIKLPNAAEIEQDLHERYEHKRLRGEWFALDAECLADIKWLFSTWHDDVEGYRVKYGEYDAN